MEKLYYGRGKDEDNKKLIAFLDEVFFSDDDDGTNFLDLLPKIYKDKYRPAYNNFVVQDEDGNFRSAVGDFYNDMLVGGEKIKTCCIGNVAVGREYRSMGYMKELMQMSVEDMRKNGVDIAYLGGQRQRYGYFGFESAGVRLVYRFNRSNIKHAFGNEPSGLTAEYLQPDDTESLKNIAALNKRYSVIAERNFENFYDILCSWNTKPRVLKENGKFVGYFVAREEIEYLSEIDVISPQYIKKAVAAVFENTDKRDLPFPTAPFETEKIKVYDETCEGVDICGCESILVYNFEKVIRAFLKAKAEYQKLCDGELTVLIHGQYGDEKLKIKSENNNISVEKYDGEAEIELEHHAATRAFFSNYSSDRAAFPPEAQQWLPLPMYFFSADTM